MTDEIRLWARANVQGETMVYCAATRELGMYVDGFIIPLNAFDVPVATLQELERAKPDLAQTGNDLYLRAEQSLGWSGSRAEYFRGVDRAQRLPDSEVPVEVRRVFGDNGGKL